MRGQTQEYFDKLDVDKKWNRLTLIMKKNQGKLRDEALDKTYGKGFAQQYEK